MELSKKVSNTFLENINMINSANKFMNNINKNVYTFDNFENNSNGFDSFRNTKTKENIKQRTISNDNNDDNYRYQSNTDKFNTEKKFDWRQIMNNNTLNQKEIEENEPLNQNILNAEISENEIRNLPENYLVHLIYSLQNIANKAIENKNNLILENTKLYNNLNQMKNQYDTVQKDNEKLNQNLLLLNKQKNTVQNINPKEIQNTTHKKRYYCKLCTNKRFINEKYLQEHINRRHPNANIENENIEKKSLVSKTNFKKFEQKLNDMKKYFEILLTQSIKKMQYIKINEKLNGIQKLIYAVNMKSHKNYNLLNKKYTDNNTNIYENINKFGNINNNENVNNNENANNNENINNKDIFETDENNKNEVDKNTKNNEAKYRQEIINYKNEIQKFKNDINQTYLRQIKEIVEIRNEENFHKIKKYFQNLQEGNKTENTPNFQIRRKNKNKTIKQKKSIILNNKYGFNQNNEEINDVQIIKNENDEKIELRNKNVQTNKKDGTTKVEKIYNTPSVKGKNLDDDKNILNLSFSEAEIQNDDVEQEEKKFYSKFRERDAQFSEEPSSYYYYLKDILPKANKDDSDMFEKIIEEKIKEKSKNSNKPFSEYIKNIRDSYLDFLSEKYGSIHSYYSRNISKFLQIAKIMDVLNEMDYQKNKLLFETINYEIKDGDISIGDKEGHTSKSNFSFGK